MDIMRAGRREAIIQWLMASGFEIYTGSMFSTAYRQFLPNTTYMVTATLHHADNPREIWERIADHGWRTAFLTKQERLEVIKLANRMMALYNSAPF